ncbi:MAG: hypothetical protein HXK12_05840 [Actinomyces sp.]|nr:hypothetical protein [Actinomyces sp.]
MASNPNQKNTQKQKTGIKTKNKHTIEFTNNTPTLPNQTHQKPAGKAKKEGHHRGHKAAATIEKSTHPTPTTSNQNHVNQHTLPFWALDFYNYCQYFTFAIRLSQRFRSGYWGLPIGEILRFF